MGAPAVIAVPSKSYVAINSYKCDKSISPTLCDLGRVSNIAAAVILPRTSNFINRNSAVQSVRSLPHKKRPISEVMNNSNSDSRHENASTEVSTTNTVDFHKKRRFVINSQSSALSLATPSAVETNLDRNHESNPQAKIMKMNSTETSSKSSMVYSPDISEENNKKTHSISHHQKPQRNLNISQSTISPPQKRFLQPDQLLTQETETLSHLSQGPKNPQLPNQHNVQLPTSRMGQVPTHHLLPMQLLQQNQLLRNENVQLQKQLSLFRQLIKNPQRLNQVITRLEQRVY